MAARRRHWKEKDGRFWARISIPSALRSRFDGKTQLTEALGGDRRVADQKHAAAVARLQAMIAQAVQSASTQESPRSQLRPSTAADHELAVWSHYSKVLGDDTHSRAKMPTPAEIEAEHETLMKRIEAGEADPDHSVSGMFNLYTEYELMAGARKFDSQRRTRRLSALRSAVGAGDTRLVDAAARQFIIDQGLKLEEDSTEWRDLCHKLARAEINALQHTLERDDGVFIDAPTDPIVKPITVPEKSVAPVQLETLFHDYIKSRQASGYHRDGGANWESVIRGLISFLGHGDATRITKRNLMDWRAALLTDGMSAKTVSDKHIAAVNAVLEWAYVEDRLLTNEAQKVRLAVPKKIRLREKGYTTTEAIKVLQASLKHMPAETNNKSNRESAHLTAAKRWVPLLCAFSGARVTEMTQLRKSDIRQEDKRWILRITPEAGSVKTGHYRDVPLHCQVMELGFIKFVEGMKDGPLFHGATAPDRYVAGSRATAGKLSAWLNALNLVPAGVQPSHGWRHRFKTQGLELGVSDRVLDAIQGHAGKTASDDYGDVTIAARLKVIDALPSFDFRNESAERGLAEGL